MRYTPRDVRLPLLWWLYGQIVVNLSRSDFQNTSFALVAGGPYCPPHTDLKHGGMMSDDHEWQAQHIVGERQTSSGLEHEVSVHKTLWLPRATLDTKLVRRYRAEHRAAQ